MTMDNGQWIMDNGLRFTHRPILFVLVIIIFNYQFSIIN